MRLDLLLIVSFLSLHSFAAPGPHCASLRVSAEQLENFREQMNCRELEIGEKRLVDKGRQISPTPLAAQYLITKTASDSYQIDLPIQFSTNSRRAILKTLGLKSNATEKDMEERLHLCAAVSDSLLKGPNGEKIKLNPITDSSQKTFWHDQIHWDIHVGHVERSNSRNYDTEVDCLVVIHELAHLLGLVDEYHEATLTPGSKGDIPKYNCRVKGPEDSLMSNHYEAMASFQGKKEDSQEYFISGLICQKENSEEKCRLESLTTQIGADQEINQEIAERLFKMSQISSSSLGMMVGFPSKTSTTESKISKIKFRKMISKQNKKSLIEPAHFRAIIYPGCKQKNALYYKCAQFAYRTYESYDNCNVPPECLDGDWLK